jgi:hypothetical protein
MGSAKNNSGSGMDDFYLKRKSESSLNGLLQDFRNNSPKFPKFTPRNQSSSIGYFSVAALLITELLITNN